MRFSKAAARNVFYGGSLFFLLVFAGLTAHSIVYIHNVSTDSEALNPSVVAGKAVWEQHSCVNCHTILGEGAYFAPEVGNAWARYGGRDDAQGARDYIVSWIASQPTGVEGRRQMPHFVLGDADLEALVDFLEWTSRTRTQNWPPTDAG